MINNLIELNAAEISDAVEKLYSSFDDGYEFERFLKVFLEKIGLDEVAVTQKARDGGIDLTAKKSGISGLSDLDETKYYIQAKRYKPSAAIGRPDIQRLRGTMPLNYKGIFITTGKFTKDAQDDAEKDDARQIILIDGENLILQCVNVGLGFDLKPVFSRLSLDKLNIKENRAAASGQTTALNEKNAIIVKKLITKNDIRARILSIPTEIFKILPEQKRMEVIINGTKTMLTFSRQRQYFASITETYRNLGLLEDGEDGNLVFNPKDARWILKDNVISILINNE